MAKKKTETRPGNSPVAVRFTEEQTRKIEEVAGEFQMSKQDVIRLSVAAGLKAMKKIGLVGMQEFIAQEITAPAKLSLVAEGEVKYSGPKKKANLMAAAGPGIFAEVTEWDGVDDTVAVQIVGDSMHPQFEDGQVVLFKHKRASRSPFMKKGLIYLVEFKAG